MKRTLAVISLLICGTANAQVGIGITLPNASAQLDVTSTSRGLLVPRMTQAQRTAIGSPATSLLVYQTDAPSGFYFYDGAGWQRLEMTGNNWSVNGNTGLTAYNYLGTTDGTPIPFKIGGTAAGEVNSSTGNTILGYSTPQGNSPGTYNVLLGYQAGYLSATAYNTGSYNIAIGYQSLQNNTGADNISIGTDAMQNSGPGSTNIAIGRFVLHSNTSGTSNVGVGPWALNTNSTGNNNTAIGQRALYRNIVDNNVAVGYNSMLFNQYGTPNTALGTSCLFNNTFGNHNTSAGYNSLYNSTTGNGNTAFGDSALYWNQTGSNNVAIGYGAGPAQTYTSLNNTIAIGTNAAVSSANSVVIGNTSTSIYGIYASGWSNISDIRFKKDVQPETHGLDLILKLKPITYHLDVEKINAHLRNKATGVVAAKQVLQSGFSAQQVEDVAKSIGYEFDAVHHPESDNDHYMLNYTAFVVPLVKAVQEQQQQIEMLSKENASLKEKTSKQDDLLLLLQTQLNTLQQEVKDLKQHL